MIKNEKIKSSEVHLFQADGTDLGIVATKDALAMARQQRVDLVCESLFTSPPVCKLVRAGDAREQQQQARKQERQPKVKEIRLSLQMEDHDLETKQMQAERILRGGDNVLLVVRTSSGKQETEAAKQLLLQWIDALQSVGTKQSAVQQSGKQCTVQLLAKG